MNVAQEYYELKTDGFFWPISPPDENDTRAVAVALNHLTYYTPDPATGFVPGRPEGLLFEALKNFQREHRVFPSGRISPRDETEQAINKALKENQVSAGPYIWRTVKDGHARAAHAAREGRVFQWSENIPGGHPGEDFNCRCWAEPYFVSYQESQKKPEVVSEQPMEENLYPDAINPVYFEIPLATLGITITMRNSVKILRAIAQKRLKRLQNLKRTKNNALTDHGALRLTQRKISDKDVAEAIKSAKENGNIKVKIGKYKTPQHHFQGSNGVTVIVETKGRNAGKVITSFRHK